MAYNTQPQIPATSNDQGTLQGLWTLGDIDKSKLLRIESVKSNIYENLSSIPQNILSTQLRDLINSAYSLATKYFNTEAANWKTTFNEEEITFKELKDFSQYFNLMPKNLLMACLDAFSNIFDQRYAIPMGDKIPFTRTSAKKN